MADDPGNKTFVKVTQKEIYKKLLDIEGHVIETNGKVKLHHKWLYGLSTLFTLILVWALSATIGG